MIEQKRPRGRPRKNADLSMADNQKINALTINKPSVRDALGSWRPSLKSADHVITAARRAADGRARDLFMTSGLVFGVVKSQQDNLVGSKYVLQLQPNYKALGVEAAIAMRWANAVEQDFMAWAENPDCYIDSQRRRTLTEFLREAVASYMLQGEVFLMRQAKPSPYGYLCFTTIEPERVCNPNGVQDDTVMSNGNKVRQGIEYTGYGEAVAYYVLKSHPSESANREWQRIQKYSNAGFLQLQHLYISTYPDQTRGFSPIVPVLKQIKMLDLQQELELQMSHLQTSHAMYLKTAGGTAAAKDLLGFGADATVEEQQLEAAIAAFDVRHTAYDGAISIDGVKVPVLLPGDEIGTVSPHNQPNNHAQLKRDLQNEISRALSISREQLTGDFSGTSYSSARAAMSMSWEGTLSNRRMILDKMASSIFRLWFDEGVLRGFVTPLVEYFPDNQVLNLITYDNLTKCSWIGSGRIVIDDYKQAKANTEKINTAQGSLQDVLKENGTDLETQINSMIAHREALLQAGLPLPAHLLPPAPAVAADSMADPLLEDSNE